jgi:hypothetical protein
MESEAVASEEVVEETAEEALEEGADLKPATKPETKEGADQTKSPVAANAGAKGAMAKPQQSKSSEEKGSATPTAQDQGATTEPDLKKV